MWSGKVIAADTAAYGLDNIRAIELLLRELLFQGLDEHAAFRAKVVVLTCCFVLRLDPCRLPISALWPGDLSHEERQTFGSLFFRIYFRIDEEQLNGIAESLDRERYWGPLVRTVLLSDGM